MTSLLILYINDELKYDKIHEKADRIYRVNRFYNSNDVNEDAATLSFPAGPALHFDYPDLSNQDVTLYLQPLTDIHLRSHHDYEMHPNSNYIYIYILSAIAAIVLILAWI